MSVTISKSCPVVIVPYLNTSIPIDVVRKTLGVLGTIKNVVYVPHHGTESADRNTKSAVVDAIVEYSEWYPSSKKTRIQLLQGDNCIVRPVGWAIKAESPFDKNTFFKFENPNKDKYNKEIIREMSPIKTLPIQDTKQDQNAMHPFFSKINTDEYDLLEKRKEVETERLRLHALRKSIQEDAYRQLAAKKQAIKEAKEAEERRKKEAEEAEEAEERRKKEAEEEARAREEWYRSLNEYEARRRQEEDRIHRHHHNTIEEDTRRHKENDFKQKAFGRIQRERESRQSPKKSQEDVNANCVMRAKKLEERISRVFSKYTDYTNGINYEECGTVPPKTKRISIIIISKTL